MLYSLSTQVISDTVHALVALELLSAPAGKKTLLTPLLDPARGGVLARSLTASGPTRRLCRRHPLTAVIICCAWLSASPHPALRGRGGRGFTGSSGAILKISLSCASSTPPSSPEAQRKARRQRLLSPLKSADAFRHSPPSSAPPPPPSSARAFSEGASFDPICFS